MWSGVRGWDTAPGWLDPTARDEIGFSTGGYRRAELVAEALDMAPNLGRHEAPLYRAFGSRIRVNALRGGRTPWSA